MAAARECARQPLGIPTTRANLRPDMKFRNFLLSLVYLLAVGCATTRPRPDPVGDYRAALVTARTNAPAPFARGSALETGALAQFKALFADLSAPNTRARVREVYAADAFFNDTLKTLHGVDAIEAYLIRARRRPRASPPPSRMWRNPTAITMSAG